VRATIVDVDQLVSALAEQQAELRSLVDGLTPHEWRAPTRCEGWDVKDVVLHVAQTNEMAIASIDARFDDFLIEMGRGLAPAADVDEGAARMVERDRTMSNDEVRARYATGATDLLARVEAADPHARVQWVAGQLSVRTLTTTRLAETWIHSGDVAAAVGASHAPGGRLQHIARLAWRTLPYAFSRAGRTMSGPVAFELVGPGGESWTFRPDERAVTTIRGDGVELCNVAARRVDPASTGLGGDGPDVAAVLELARTYA
jgi:uncharacterized protein (TIGR03084 family)